MIDVVYQLPYTCNVASRLKLPLLFNIATDEEPSLKNPHTLEIGFVIQTALF